MRRATVGWLSALADGKCLESVTSRKPGAACLEKGRVAL